MPAYRWIDGFLWKHSGVIYMSQFGGNSTLDPDGPLMLDLGNINLVALALGQLFKILLNMLGLFYMLKENKVKF